MKTIKRVTCMLCLIAVAAVARGEAVIVYHSASNAEEALIERQLKESGVVESAVEFINQHFRLEETLTFLVGDDDGPLYSSETNQISLPYFFLNEVEARFESANYDETGITVEQATNDALLHTLFHEFAHAAIYMYELPVVGREEDAADALATFLLIDYFEQGQEIAISAADLFDLESTDKASLEEEDYWGEHSLDKQRYYSILCHVYGSNPEEYASIPEQHAFSEERADMCIYEYEDLVRSWLTLLEPYLLDDR